MALESCVSIENCTTEQLWIQELSQELHPRGPNGQFCAGYDTHVDHDEVDHI